MNKVLLIVLMMAVTYIPRLLPFLAMQGKKPPSAHSPAGRFLSFIPYAALGALILPGGLTAVPGEPLAAVAGLVSAAAVSFLFRSVGWSVLVSVLVVYGFLTVF